MKVVLTYTYIISILLPNNYIFNYTIFYFVYSILFYFYRFVSILTVFVNKTLLSVDKLDVDAPIFIVWFQCLVSAIICFVLSHLSKMFPNIIHFPDGNPFNKVTIKKASYFFDITLIDNYILYGYLFLSHY